MTWQPIETAPKDGTELLGYRPPHRNRRSIYLFRWSRATKGWVSTHDNVPNAPTHWTTLPPPPEKSDEAPQA